MLVGRRHTLDCVSCTPNRVTTTCPHRHSIDARSPDAQLFRNDVAVAQECARVMIDDGSGKNYRYGCPEGIARQQMSRSACVCAAAGPSLEVMGALNMDGGLQCRALPDVALIVRL